MFSSHFKKPWLKENWFWPHRYWVNLFGLWGEEAESPFLKRWLPRLRAFLLVYVVVFEMSVIMAVMKNIAEKGLLNNIFLLFEAGSTFIGCLKFYLTYSQKDNFKTAMDLLDELLLEVNGPVVDNIINRGLRRIWTIFITIILLGSLITIHWLSGPLIDIFYYEKKSRLFKTWPSLMETWPQVAITQAFQFPIIMVIGQTFYLTDIIYICTAEFILCNFEALKYELHNLSLSADRDNSEKIAFCVRYHNKILRICTKLRDGSVILILWQSMASVIMLCSGVFYFAKDETATLVTSINIGEIIFMITVVLYFFCWYSNEITLQCIEVSNSAYMSNWLNGTDKDKKSLCIIMTRARKPIYFGGILKLDLNTFINIVKTAFSYYNFMIAMETTATPNEK